MHAMHCHGVHTGAYLPVSAGLQPGTTYYYSVAGHPDGPWSKEFNFTTYTAKATFPFRIGYMGDLGNSKNATATVSIRTSATSSTAVICKQLVVPAQQMPSAVPLLDALQPADLELNKQNIMSPTLL